MSNKIFELIEEKLTLDFFILPRLDLHISAMFLKIMLI